MWQCEPEPEARRVYECGSASRSRRRGESMNLDVIVSLCKRRGFIFQSSEIYGGIASCWDYGSPRVRLNKKPKTGGGAGHPLPPPPPGRLPPGIPPAPPPLR